MPKWKLVVEYQGTRYRGWQEQANSRTVQGEIRKAAEDLLQRKIELVGSGRTDAGVHALYQVAHLQSSRSIDPVSLRRGINDRLPADINIRAVEQVPPRFHARYHAEERFYLYQISTERTAFGKHFVWWVKDPLDVGTMSETCARFKGRKDFSVYCEKEKDSSGAIVEVTDCRIEVWRSLILFRIAASHFLWKMVRRIVGVLVEIGRGHLRPREIDFLTHNQVARWTAPPSGLFLEYVRYPGDDPPGPLTPAIFSKYQ